MAIGGFVILIIMLSLELPTIASSSGLAAPRTQPPPSHKKSPPQIHTAKHPPPSKSHSPLSKQHRPPPKKVTPTVTRKYPPPHPPPDYRTSKPHRPPPPVAYKRPAPPPHRLPPPPPHRNPPSKPTSPTRSPPSPPPRPSLAVVHSSPPHPPPVHSPPVPNPNLESSSPPGNNLPPPSFILPPVSSLPQSSPPQFSPPPGTSAPPQLNQPPPQAPQPPKLPQRPPPPSAYSPPLPPFNAAQISVSTLVTGSAAGVMGIELGHANDESNAIEWHRYMGASSGRFFVQPFSSLSVHITGSAGSSYYNASRWGVSLSGSYVNDVTGYTAAVAELRTPNGRSLSYTGFQAPLRYAAYNSALGTGNGFLGNPADSVAWLAGLGQDLMIVLPGGCGSNSVFFNLTSQDSKAPVYWRERWEMYKFIYAMGRWAFTQTITRIELYNEPELQRKYGCISNASWVDHLRIRTAALRAVYADMNTDTNAGRKLSVYAAPFSVAGHYNSSLAQLSVQNLHNTFPSGVNDTTVLNFDVFSHHSYTKVGGNMRSDTIGLRAGMTADLSADVAAYRALPAFAITEYNSNTAALFDASTETANDVTAAAKLAVQTLYEVQVVDILYVFKFSMTPSSTQRASGVVKNGMHYGSANTYPYNIGDSTRSAEAWRLIATTVRGRALFSVNATLPVPSTQSAVAASDGRNYYLLVGNNDVLAMQLSINLKGWSIAAGTTVLATELSTSRYGELAPIIVVKAGSLFTYFQPAQSLVLFTIPATLRKIVTLLPTDDTVLRAGSFQGASLTGAEPSLTVQTSTNSTQDGTQVALLKFNTTTSGVDYGDITAAVLTLHVSAAGPGLNQFLVLGVQGWNESWRETNVTWGSHPNLFTLNSGSLVNSVSSNFLQWRGTSPGLQIVGHITFNGAVTQTASDFRSLDVTPFLKQAGSGVKTFMIVRTFRADLSCTVAAGVVPCTGPVAGDSLTGSSLTFDSKESSVPSYAPALTLYHQ